MRWWASQSFYKGWFTENMEESGTVYTWNTHPCISFCLLFMVDTLLQTKVLPFVSWIEFFAAYMKLHSLTLPSLWIMNMPFLTTHFQHLKYINFLKRLPDPTSFPTTSYCPISWFPFTSKILAISWESLQITKCWRCEEKGAFIHC